MTKFIGGPAAGKTLLLKRHPLYLRVTCVQSEGFEPTSWDALDQLEDKPTEHETIYAYRLKSNDGTVHINRGRQGGGFYPIATYAFIERQPADQIMRSSQAWAEWTEAEYERS